MIWHTCPDHPDGHAAALTGQATRLPCGCVVRRATCGGSVVTWVSDWCEGHEVPW